MPPGIERLLPVDGLNGVAAVSPDQRLFAAPVDDGDVRIVDFATGRTLRTLQGGGAGLLNVTAFSPDGGLLVSGGRDGLIRLWDGRTGRSVGEPFRGGSGAVWGAFDPTDSTTLFTVSPRSVLRWDVSRPDHPVRVGAAFGFPDEPLEAVSMRTSPDGRLVAVGGLTGGRAVVWDVDAGMRVAEYEGRPGVFTADGSTLVVVRRDHLAFIDLATGAEQGERITGFTTVAPGLVMSPDGQRLAVADFTDSSIRVFDVVTRQQVGETLRLFTGFSSPAAFLDRDRLLVTGGRSQHAAVWRFAERAPALATALHPGHNGRVDAQFTPNGGEVITIGIEDDRTLRWRARDGQRLGELLVGGAAPAGPFAFSPDGETVAIRQPDGSVGVFDVRTGRRVSVFRTGQPAPRPAWSPNGSVLATVANDLSLVLWDVTDRRHPSERTRLRIGTPREGQQLIAVFSPDGDVIAASQWRNYPAGFVDPASTIIDVESGRILRNVARGGLVAFSPDGRSLLTSNTGSADLLGLLDVSTGKPRWLRSFPAWVFGVAFVDGGARIATVRYPGGVAAVPTPSPALEPAVVVELWDAATSRPIGEPMIARGYAPTPARETPTARSWSTGRKTESPSSGTSTPDIGRPSCAGSRAEISRRPNGTCISQSTNTTRPAPARRIDELPRPDDLTAWAPARARDARAVR